MGFIDVCNSLAEVVRGGWAIVDALESQDGLVGVLGNFGSAWCGGYLLKLRNLARTQRRTCLPGPAFAIFLLLGAEAATSDIWLKLIILINNINIRNKCSNGRNITAWRARRRAPTRGRKGSAMRWFASFLCTFAGCGWSGDRPRLRRWTSLGRSSIFCRRIVHKLFAVVASTGVQICSCSNRRLSSRLWSFRGRWDPCAHRRSISIPSAGFLPSQTYW